MLELQWSLDARQCGVSVDGMAILDLPLLRDAKSGASYFRIRSTAKDRDPAGLFIECVSMDASQ